MHLPEPNTRMPLLRPVKETMVNSNTYASVVRVGRITANEHGLVMVRKVAPDQQ